MKRRKFLTGSLLATASLAGCSSSPSSSGEATTSNPTRIVSTSQSEGNNLSPTSNTKPTLSQTETVEPAVTTNSQREARTDTLSSSSQTETQQTPSATCGDVNEISFYALGEIADNIWTRNSIWVDLTLETTAQVRLVAVENGSTLGVTRVKLTTADSTLSQTKYITLSSSLSGEHTIQVIAYPAIGEDSEFDRESIEPCRNENGVIQTEPTTINFSDFPQGTPVTSRGE